MDDTSTARLIIVTHAEHSTAEHYVRYIKYTVNRCAQLRRCTTIVEREHRHQNQNNANTSQLDASHSSSRNSSSIKIVLAVARFADDFFVHS